MSEVSSGEAAESAEGQPSHGWLERVDLGEVPYAAAQTDMARWAEERKQGLAANRLFLLTHPAVITYTARTPNDQLPDAASPIDLVQTDRGGHATYHGPGQLIGYLVLNVRELGPRGLIRRVEQALIDAPDTLGFPAVRRETPPGEESLVGVWTPDQRKLASIGMRISGSKPRLRWSDTLTELITCWWSASVKAQGQWQALPPTSLPLVPERGRLRHERSSCGGSGLRLTSSALESVAFGV